MTAVLCNYCSPAPTNPQCTVSSCRHTRPPLLSALLSRPTAPHRQNSPERPEHIVHSHTMTTLTCPTNEKKSSAAGNKPPSSPGFRVSKITLFTAFHLPGWHLHTCPVDFIHSSLLNDLQTTRQPSWSTNNPLPKIFFNYRQHTVTPAIAHHDGLSEPRGPGRRPQLLQLTTSTTQLVTSKYQMS